MQTSRVILFLNLFKRGKFSLEVDPLVLIFIFVAGLIFGTIAPMVGIGGGLLNVPFLIFLIGISPSSDATLISSIAVLFTSLSASITYIRQKRVDIRTGLIFAAFAVPGGVLGGFLAQRVVTDSDVIKLLFAVLIGLSAIYNIAKAYRRSKKPVEEIVHHKKGRFVVKRKVVDSDGDTIEYEANLGIGVLFSFVGGILAGMLGVGGGIIYVPTLYNFVGVPFHFAASTSSFIIVFAVAFVLITRLSLYSGNYLTLFTYALPLAVGAVIGARFGASKAKKISSTKLIIAFWSLALFAAIRMGYTPFLHLF